MSHADTPKVTVVAGVVRGVRICLVLMARLAVLGGLALRCSLAPGRSGFTPRRDAWLLATVTALGPAFVKVAQILSTRADVVPRHVARVLSTLHDQVRPLPLGDASRHFGPELRRALRDDGAGLAARHPVAAGTIACVYRADLADGRTVALKVRRPGVVRQLSTDLAIMLALARLVAPLPPLRGVPVADIMRQLAESLRGQLDFHRERRSLRFLKENLAEVPDVRVPQVYDELCGPEVLVMEYLDDLHQRPPAGTDGEQAAVTALRAAYHMLFLDGFVHCDLHPGNLSCGPGRAVTIVDAGFTVRLTEHARHKFTDFFHAMSLGDGQACADIVLSTARPGRDTDTAAFRRDLAALIESCGGATAATFDLMDFAVQLFALQRRHGLYADPQFVFPILSLLVLEGTVRALGPGLDFQAVAKPYLMIALMERAIAAAQRKQESG
ncbi:AarF/UbiB family protein [Streptomyces ficellus]|uniref:AarF/UbiB family protein n=1 Tax=Streptomyces ficellus TaxID=1977088 RepID=A0ABT7Z926_9ACTN|nr:AarF/UbiB family protein [Streptomyces ficellus]MDN3295966.1 AarF/UbiB family protein [Streptomyces ficellus]